jgi:hypothetical protein
MGIHSSGTPPLQQAQTVGFRKHQVQDNDIVLGTFCFEGGLFTVVSNIDSVTLFFQTLAE